MKPERFSIPTGLAEQVEYHEERAEIASGKGRYGEAEYHALRADRLSRRLADRETR